MVCSLGWQGIKLCLLFWLVLPRGNGLATAGLVWEFCIQMSLCFLNDLMSGVAKLAVKLAATFTLTFPGVHLHAWDLFILLCTFRPCLVSWFAHALFLKFLLIWLVLPRGNGLATTGCTFWCIFVLVNELAERGLAFATLGLVFLPLWGRTNHPLITALLAHGFSPALRYVPRVGSSAGSDGWPLASLCCWLLTALCEPHAPCFFKLTGDRVTTSCSDRQVTALVTDSELAEEDMSRDMLLRSWFWQDWIVIPSYEGSNTHQEIDDHCQIVVAHSLVKRAILSLLEHVFHCISSFLSLPTSSFSKFIPLREREPRPSRVNSFKCGTILYRPPQTNWFLEQHFHLKKTKITIITFEVY